LQSTFKGTSQYTFLPTTEQIGNRKKTLKRIHQRNLGYDLNTNSGFDTWIRQHTVHKIVFMI